MIAAILLAAGSFISVAELRGSIDPGSGRFLIDAIHDARTWADVPRTLSIGY